MAAIHELVGGKVQLFKRDRSPYWWCSATIGGERQRISTKKENLKEATAFAEDWGLELRGKDRWGGGAKRGTTFKVAAERFLAEFEIITEGQRSPVYVAGHKGRVTNHLIPFFGDMVLTEITSGTIQDYRIHRVKTGPMHKGQMAAEAKAKAEGTFKEKKVRPLGRSTLHQEMVCLRQILKTAHRQGWLPMLPDLTAPYKSSGKIKHRAWFSPEEYTILRDATRDRAKNPKKERWRDECENLHDFVLFMVNTGLRPDEALRLEFRDVAIVTDEATGERILEIEVRGKRGVGFCKSMPGAVLPLRRTMDRHQKILRATLEAAGDPDAASAKVLPTQRVFPSLQRELFNDILTELKMKKDRDNQPRTFYSLRHTYICMRLMEGADIYQVAKNCRTSVEMIENYYASHIKNTIDAAAINIRKPKKTAARRGKTDAETPPKSRRKPKSASTASA